MLNVELGIRHINSSFIIQHSTFNIIKNNEVYIMECQWLASMRR